MRCENSSEKYVERDELRLLRQRIFAAGNSGGAAGDGVIIAAADIGPGGDDLSVFARKAHVHQPAFAGELEHGFAQRPRVEKVKVALLFRGEQPVAQLRRNGAAGLHIDANGALGERDEDVGIRVAQGEKEVIVPDEIRLAAGGAADLRAGDAAGEVQRMAQQGIGRGAAVGFFVQLCCKQVDFNAPPFRLRIEKS